MGFLQNIFGKKDTDQPVTNYQQFWHWFKLHHKTFFNVVKQQKDIEDSFFEPLTQKLQQLGEGFYFLTGMADDQTAELILTPDGNIRNIVFIEELVAAAPVLAGWHFTALKPASDIKDVAIRMGEYEYRSDNLHFLPNELEDYPDEIDITVIYDQFSQQDEETITNGVYIFLDNFLGELRSVTAIDNLAVAGRDLAQTEELVPIHKLRDYLIWREKEFVEKYDSVIYDGDNDEFSLLQAEYDDGTPVLAAINTTALEWPYKASHPWILDVECRYKGDSNGLPDGDTLGLLNAIEDVFIDALKNAGDVINIGRETAKGKRNCYWACRDFREVSKVANGLIKAHEEGMPITYKIFKDKYWQAFDHFRTPL